MADNQQIIISFQADTSGLEPAYRALNGLGKITDDQLKQFLADTAKAQQVVNKAATDAAGSVKKLDSAIKEVGKSVATAVVLDKSADVVKTTSALGSMRQQLRQAVNEAQLLADKFGSTDARAVAAAKRAAELADRIDQTNQNIRALNPDEKFNAIIKLGAGITAAFSGAQAAIALFGGESELAKKAAEDFQKVLAISQGLNGILALKDSFTALKVAIGFTTVATEAKAVADGRAAVAAGVNAAAMEGEAVAAETATVANQGFAASLALTGVGAALVIVLGAIAYAYAQVAKDAEEAADRQERFKQGARDIATAEQNLAAIRDQNRALQEEDFKFQAERNKLQQDFAKENYKVYQQQIEQNRATEESLKRVTALEKDLQDIRSNTGLEGGERRRLAAAKQEELNLAKQKYSDELRLKEQADRQVEIAEQTLAERKKNIGIRETQFKKEQLDKQVKDAKLSTEELKKLDFGITNKEDFDNASRLIDQYYGSLELSAKKSAKTSEELEIKLAELKVQKQAELIEAAKLFFQDSQALESQNFDFIKDLEEKKAKVKANLYSSIEKDSQDQADIAKNLEQVTNDLDEKVSISQKQREELRIKERDLSIRLAQEVAETSINFYKDRLDAEIDLLREQQDKASEIYDEQLAKNQDRVSKEIISKREGERIEREILDRKRKAEEENQKKIAELRRKQDLIERAQKLFQIGISTAVNIVQQPGPLGAFIPFWAALGAVQSAAVLATPLPKYAKGTLSLQRGKNPVGVDTIPILANEGEAITPTREAREYHPTLKAIHSRQIPSFVLNDFVKSYRVKPISNVSNVTNNSLDIDYDLLAEKIGGNIAWSMRDHKTVMKSGFKSLAEALNNGSVENNYRLRS